MPDRYLSRKAGDLAFSLPQGVTSMDILPKPHVTHPGMLIAIGGAEDKTRERVILRYFLEAAGGPDASVVVLGTASDVPETGDRYADLFLALRAENVEVLKIDSREDAMEAGAEAHDLLEYATGLFITGGSQLKLSSALGGTEIASTVRRRHAAPPPRPPGQGSRPRSGPRDRSALPAPRPPRPAADGAFLQSRASRRGYRRGHGRHHQRRRRDLRPRRRRRDGGGRLRHALHRQPRHPPRAGGGDDGAQARLPDHRLPLRPQEPDGHRASSDAPPLRSHGPARPGPVAGDVGRDCRGLGGRRRIESPNQQIQPTGPITF